MDHMQIRALLPHRYPFLLVDSIVEMDRGVRCVGVKNVTWADAWYLDLPEGVDREETAYPLHLQIESFAQVGGLLYLASLAKPDFNDVYVMLAGSVRGVSVKGNVYPGEQMFSEVRFTRCLNDTVVVEGKVEKAAPGSEVRTRVAEIDQMMIAFRPKAQFLAEGGS